MEENKYSRSTISFYRVYFINKVRTLWLVIFIANVLLLSSSLANPNSSLISITNENLETPNGINWPYLNSYMPPVEICNNGIDDDGDTLVDCDDPDCFLEEASSSDIPKTISSSSATTITSTLNISESGTIEDINLKNLDITHSYIDDVIVRLISPANTTVIVLNRPCTSENNIYMTLDDEASTGSFPCPPTNGLSYIPSNPLSAFDGEEMNGVWTLSVQDIYGPADGGSLDGWTLEISKECSAAAEICDNGIDDDGDMLVDCDDPDCNTSGDVLSAFGDVRNGPASNAVGAPDDVTTEIGHVDDYLVVTLEDELPVGTDYTIYMSGRNGSATADVWEAPAGTSLPSSQQTTPAGFTFNGQATGPPDVVTPIIKTTIVSTKYIYFDRGSGDIEIDAVTYSIPCTTSVEICDNGIDDDGDMLVDCDDPDCNGNSACQGCNIASNPEFDNGTTSWTLNNNSTAASTLSLDNTSQLSGTNSAFIDVTSATGTEWHIQFLSGPYTIDATKTYNISFEAKATANKDIVVSAQQSDSPYTTYYWSPDISITTTAQTYTLPNITMSASASDALLKFYFGNDVNDIWIDNIVFEEVGCTTSNVEICDNGIDDDGDMLVDCDDPDCTGNSTCVDCNLLGNTDFNQGNSYWFLAETSPATGTWSVDNTGQLSGANSAFIDVTNTTGIDWNLQFRAGALTIDNSKTYNISFEAKATGNKVIDISLQQNQSPYTTFYTSDDMVITTAAQTFTIPNVTVSASANDALFKFHLGSDSNDIWIDNIVFEEVGCTPPSTGFDNEVCYFISDGVQSESGIPDTFYTFNYVTSAVQAIGPTLTEGIEAMAMDTVNEIIYVVDYDEFGMINLANGAFTSIKSDIGTVNGAEGILNIDDVDGMTFDHSNNIIWATERRDDYVNNDGAPDDLLFQIDPITGSPIADAFGSGVDYVVVSTPENDLDDIAIADDGTLYAISNYGGSGNQAFGTINKTTGAWTEMGDYGVEDVESLAFTATGQLVATTGKDGANKNQLYTIDAGTGIATYVGSVAPANDVEACDCISASLINLQIGDKVWADLDSDGLQGISEPGVSGVVVNLLTNTGSPYLNDLGNPTTTTTDALGNYLFDELPEGQYIVEFVLSGGTSFSPQDVGSDDELDSDANTSTGRTAVLTLANSTNDLSIDAGVLNTNLVEICENGVDDDGDGLTDCEDIDCGMVLNREFDSGTTNWSLYNSGSNASTLTIDNGSVLSGVNSANVNITAIGSEVWHTQLEQSGLSIEAGKTYRIYFKARSTLNREIEVMIQQTNSPNTVYFIQIAQTANFNAQYVYEFTSNATEANVDLTFNLGQNTGDVWIDDVQFKEVCPDPECILPTADAFDVCGGQILSNTVASNDSIQDEVFNINYQITSPPLKGNVTMEEDGDFTYTPNVGESGADQFTYERCYSFKDSLGLTDIVFNPCGDGKIIETFIEGIEGESSPSVLISNPTDLSKVIVEVWSEASCTPPIIEGVTSVESDVFRSDGTMDVEKIYRAELTTVSADGLIDISNPGGCSLASAVAYVERIQSNGQGSSTLITSNIDLVHWYVSSPDDCFVFNMPIGSSDISRDITFTIPLHEKENTKTVNATVTAGSLTASASTSTWSAIGQGAGEIVITLSNVPADVQVASVQVCSPQSIGDSFGVGIISASSSLCTAETTFECCSETTADINITGASISNSSPTNCYGNGNATLIASDNASSASYSYAWSHSSETTAQVNVSPTTTTSYVVTVTNAEGCISTAETTVEVYPEINLNISNSGTDCLEFNTQLTANASGGGAGFNYVWSGPSGFSETTAIVDIAESGLYSVTVTDANGCTREAAETVHPTFNPSITTTESEICVGSNTDISISGTGITAYQWSTNTGGATTSSVTVSPTSTTIYLVTVTDNQGCTAIRSSTIVVNDLPLVSVTGPTAICEGFTTQLSPTSGGTWTSNNTGIATVANDGTVTGVSVGSTTFVFTNTTTGCVSDATQPITINEIPAVSITGSSSICEDETTTLSPTTGGTWVSSNTAIATVTNGGLVTGISAGNVTFTFTDNTTLCSSAASNTVTVLAKSVVSVTDPTSICEGFTTQLSPTSGGTWTSNNTGIATVANDGTVTGVSAGSTTFVFTNASTGCASDETQPIAVNAIPSVSITGPSNICIGSTTTVTPNSGGTWTSSNAAVATITNGGIVTGVSDGTATFTFTSNEGCVSAQTNDITIIPQNNITISGNPIVCLGETAQLTASAGGGSWSSGNPAIATINASGLVTAIADGTVTITYDHNSGACSIDPTFGIVIKALPTVTISGTNTICVGEVTQLTTNGTGGFWTGSDSNIAIVSTEGIVVGISAGTVTFTYTDGDGCESSASGTITVDPPVDVAIDFNGSLCLEDDSQLSALATGGTAGFTYSWTGPNSFTGSTQTVNITDDGNYDVTVTDSKGCSTNTSAFVYEQYDPFISSLSSEVCEGEDITLTVSGANGGTFQWSANANNATTASVTVTPTFPSSSYTVTVTNAIGCTTSSTAVIDVLTRPVANLTGSNDICVGETTQLSPSSGGTWTSSNYSVANVNNAGLVTGLGGGSVVFTFQDDVTQCYSDPTSIVTVNDNTTPVISGQDHICMVDNPILTASVLGGTWSSNNSAIATIHSSTGEITPVSQGSAVITYIPPSSGCYNNSTYTIYTYDEPTLSVNGPSTICEGSITYVNASVSGTWTSSDESVATVTNIGEVTGVGAGTATFSFVSTVGCAANLATPITVIATPNTILTGPSEICINETTTLSPTSGGIWISSNNSVATVNSSGIVTGILDGTATFVFIEANYGCISTNNIEVTVDAPPNITAPSTNSMCIGEVATITPTTGGFWKSSNPSIASISNDGTITALTDGTVTFTFTSDLTGCTSLQSSPVTVMPTPTTNFSGPTSICQNETTSILPSVGGYWSTTDISKAIITNQGIITAISPGTVRFIFTNSNSGCVSDSSAVLTIEPPTTVEVTGPGNICVGETSQLTPSTGGTWTSSNTGIATVTNSGVITGLSSGSVTFTFENATGCSSDPTEAVVIESSPNVTYIGSSSICVGEITSLSPVTGGNWTSSNTSVATITNSGIVTAIAVGTVSLTFTDATTGCSASASADLTVNAPPIINIIGDSEICIGQTTNLSPATGGAWISSDNSVASIASNGMVTGLSVGTATFTFVETSTGCSSLESAPITILAKPDVSILGANTICAGSTTTLSPSTGGSWSSDNASVATVTNNGIVTGVSQGIAKFTFTSSGGCTSNQTAPIIVFDSPSTTIDGPNSICINATVQMLPSSGGTWLSADPTIASVDNSGLVTALMAGTTTFTFTDSNLGCVSEPSEPLTVEAIPAIGLVGPSEICIGGTTNMTPATGGNWTSLDPLIATIQNNGEIVGIGSGEAKFIFMNLATGCVSDTSSGITVLASPTVSFIGPAEICSGDTTYISPSTGGTWESNNPAVASISNTGMIIGVGQGIATFKYTDSTNGCISENSDALTVNSIGAEYAVDDNICVGGTTTLYPDSGGTWISLNPEIATVTALGVVTGVASGTAYFVFTDSTTGCSSDGTLDVVVESGSPIVISGASEVCIGYTTTLSPSAGGVWTSNNENIATVSNTGVVTGKAPGKVSFTFTESSSGCLIVSTSDSITVESCKNHDFNVSIINEVFYGNLSTNDNFPVTATYSNTPQLISKPNASIVTFNINPDGSYSFEGNKAGNYRYNVPVCLDPNYSGCPTTMIEITLVENQYSTGNPVTNLDIATVFSIEAGGKYRFAGGTYEINSIQNDVCIYTLGCDMDWSSAWIDANASNGWAEVVANGVIEYTPDAGFIGFDTIYYGMCADGYSKCNTTLQVMTVNHSTAENSIVASDDFTFTLRGSSISGNVLTNDSDAEGDSIIVTPQGSLMSPVVVPAGEYYIDALGDFNFTPNDAFSGHTEIIYQICDDNADQACMEATLHLLVFDDISVKLRVYLEGALMQNGGAVSATGLPLMRDDLRVSPFTGENYLPLMDPYTIAADPWAGTHTQFNKLGPGLLAENIEITDSIGVFGVSGDNAIVDWVHVELRSKVDMAIPIATRAGLLQRDGDVVDLDGVSDLRFNAVNVDSFYVVVKHRSHLGVMSQKVAYSDEVDFTSPQCPVYNFGIQGLNDYSGLSQNTNVKAGHLALWAGDFDSNGKIKFTNPGDDQNVLFVDVLFTSPEFLINYDQAYGYMTGDYNMNSKTKYTNPSDDINFLFAQILLYPLNSAFLSNYNSLIEQIPEEE